MGEDKATMIFKGKPMIQWSIDALSNLSLEVKISSSNPTHKKFGFELINDEFQNIGPVGAIYSCLNEAKTDRVLFTCCDYPLLDESFYKTLIEAYNNEQIFIVKSHPLIGIYSKSCLPIIKESIVDGQYKVMGSVKKCNFKEFNADEFKQLLKNVNEKSDIE
jgi:molybdopterin-guanine dinucleotide biosynthesis protein A